MKDLKNRKVSVDNKQMWCARGMVLVSLGCVGVSAAFCEDSPELTYWKEQAAIAEAKQKIAAASKPQNVQPLAGEFKADDIRIQSQILTHKAAEVAAMQIANAIRSRVNNKTLVIANPQTVADLNFLRAWTVNQKAVLALYSEYIDEAAPSATKDIPDNCKNPLPEIDTSHDSKNIQNLIGAIEKSSRNLGKANKEVNDMRWRLNRAQQVQKTNKNKSALETTQTTKELVDATAAFANAVAEQQKAKAEVEATRMSLLKSTEDENKDSRSLGGLAGVGMAATGLSAAVGPVLDIAAFFRTDTEIKGINTKVAETALASHLVKALNFPRVSLGDATPLALKPSEIYIPSALAIQPANSSIGDFLTLQDKKATLAKKVKKYKEEMERLTECRKQHVNHPKAYKALGAWIDAYKTDVSEYEALNAQCETLTSADAKTMLVRAEGLRQVVEAKKPDLLALTVEDAAGERRIVKSGLPFTNGKMTHSGGVIVSYMLFNSEGAVQAADEISVYAPFTGEIRSGYSLKVVKNQ